MVACWQVTQSNAPIVCSKFSGQAGNMSKNRPSHENLCLKIAIFH